MGRLNIDQEFQVHHLYHHFHFCIFFKVLELSNALAHDDKNCPLIHNVEKISGPKRIIKVTNHFTCASANVISCITCTNCKKVIRYCSLPFLHINTLANHNSSIRSDRRRPYARNVRIETFFKDGLCTVDNTKLPCYTPPLTQRHSFILEIYPLYSFLFSL